MPAKHHGKVRRMLKNGQAKLVKRCQFTIQLLYDTTNYTQPINLGIDAGSKHIGLSATTENKELYSADVELRNDTVDLISTRRENRRNRKTRYRLHYVKPAIVGIIKEYHLKMQLLWAL